MTGRVIGHYRVLSKLGEGGMGVVYEAEDVRLGRKAALKFLSPALTAVDEARRRFEREAQAAARLDHPNICTVYGIEEYEGETFVAMALLQGRTIEERLKEEGSLPVDEAVELARQAASGLRAAHREGILHRDIKPSNLMCVEGPDGEPQVKIVDFGLAQFHDKSGLTREGTTVGTVAYMSPEQLEGREVDERSDVWSLGAVLYEMLAGKPPFDGGVDAVVVYSALNEDPESLETIRPEVPAELVDLVARALQKDPAERLPSMEAFRRKLAGLQARPEPVNPPGRGWKRPLAVATVSTALLIGLFVYRAGHQDVDAEATLLRIEQLLSADDRFAAYYLALDAWDELGDNATFQRLAERVFRLGSLRSEPHGADVAIREYGRYDEEWRRLGQTPLENQRFPRGLSQIRMEAPGYQSLEFAVLPQALRDGMLIELAPLDPNREPEVRVPTGDVDSVTLPHVRKSGVVEPTELPAFYFGKFEVTNRRFAEFVEGGGYSDSNLWKTPFVLDGRTIPFKEAMEHFVDSTGLPGPSTWRLGTYPEDRPDDPVGGVSWYEAAAFAEFVGKTLPTAYHWYAASGSTRFAEHLVPSSNFGDGPKPVGSSPARSPVGAADTAGNVREWCWNAVVGSDERLSLGAAWNDPSYQFDRFLARDPFDRDPGNGIRLADFEPEELPVELFEPMQRAHREYSLERPVDDQQFETMRRVYAYDPTPLNSRIDTTVEAKYWTLQRVSYDSAYGERIPAYFFVPNDARAPYQTVVFFPGSGPEYTGDSTRIEGGSPWVEALVRSGRAVLFPVYKGHFERRIREPQPVYLTLDAPAPPRPRARRDLVVMTIRDVLRSVDYLESREDVREDALAYVGYSAGARLGAIALGLEERFRAAVLMHGGLHLTPRDLRQPESDEINFLPHIETPTLLVNGRFDPLFPPEESQQYFFDWLGLPDDQKRHVITDRGHGGFADDEIRETLAWLDQWLGVPE